MPPFTTRALVGITVILSLGLSGTAADRTNDRSRAKTVHVNSAPVVSRAPLKTNLRIGRVESFGEMIQKAQVQIAIATRATAPQPVIQLQPRVVLMEVTAYCPCSQCCGEDASGITASGKDVSYAHGHFVAADTELLPFGTRLKIPGYHEAEAVEVIDRGGAIKGNKIDVFFETHEEALEWGRQWVEVTILP